MYREKTLKTAYRDPCQRKTNGGSEHCDNAWNLKDMGVPQLEKIVEAEVAAK